MFEGVPIFSEDIEDFPIEADVNQVTSFPALEKYCNCGELIGMYQRVIESMIGKRLREFPIEDRNEALSQIRREVFKELGVTRDCCLMKLTVYPFHCINDIHGIDSFVDTTMLDNTVTEESSLSKPRPKIRNRYTVSGKVFKGGKRTANVAGSKQFVGYYPLSFETAPNFSEFEQKLFKISRSNVISEKETPAILAFPLRELNDELKLIEPYIPTPMNNLK